MTRAVFFDSKVNTWMEMINLAQIYCASDKKDVPEILDIVENSAKQGLYVAGFVSYEAASSFDKSLKHQELHDTPLAWFAEFRDIRPFELSENDDAIDLYPVTEDENFISSVMRIRNFLESGEVYQVNLTQKLHGDPGNSPTNIFSKLVRTQPSPYAMLLESDDFSICSASPELFFSKRGRMIEMQPMKGTRARGRFNEEDKKNKEDLKSSEKDRAENLMILDMVRNDLGKICLPGSLSTPKLFELHSFPTVWQQTSSVVGETDCSLSQIFSSVFPCASVTGAPKVRAMEIIADLEPYPRGVYTGATGFLKPEGETLFNVSIRTIYIDKVKSSATYGIGSGIVWDSDPEAELAESFAKAKILNFPSLSFELFETMKYTPREGIFLVEEHFDRIKSSALRFNYRFDENEAMALLAAIDNDDPLKVRLVVNKEGVPRLESSPLNISRKEVQLKIAKHPIDSGNIFLFHKTTNREAYDRAKKEVFDCDDVLLFNERGQITETTTANIFLEKKGALLTPPIECGLLPGTLRASLLKKKEVTEKILTFDDLSNADNIFVGNSVRGLQRAKV
ncbi:MAG: chorismate-binding protein, partial [Pseudomonadota bacterium]|nr:chorismate-binding protein [Pseudomonadota bacterium]